MTGPFGHYFQKDFLESGEALTPSNNLSDLASAATARTNLGLDDLLGNDDPNVVVNGCGQVAQEGTSVALSSTGQVGLDCWYWIQGGAARATVTQDTTLAPPSEIDYEVRTSHKLDVTTASGGVGASEWYSYQHRVEGYLADAIRRQGGTLQAIVQSPKTGVHVMSARSSNGDRCCPLEYTIDAADTPQLVTLTIPEFDTVGGTFNQDNTTGLFHEWLLAYGGDFDSGTAGSWQAATSNDTMGTAAGQGTDVLDNTANNFFITDVRLVPGTVATKTPPRSLQKELALCERYFKKSFEYATTPADGVSQYGNAANAQTFATGTVFLFVKFPCQMRDDPSITLYNPRGGGTAGRMTNSSTDGTGATAAANVEKKGFMIQSNGGSLGANNWYCHWTADARL